MPKSINWEQLRGEFLASDESLNQFRIRHGISRDYFYVKTKSWPAERTQTREDAISIIKDKAIPEMYEQFVTQQKSILQMLNVQIIELYKKTLDKDGKNVIAPLKSGELVNIANTVSLALKSFRLIEGKSTGDEGGGPENYWTNLIAFVNGKPTKLPEQAPQRIEYAQRSPKSD